MRSLADNLCAYSDASFMEQSFDERIKDLSAAEQEAVKRFWRSLVMRSQRAFSEENGRLLQNANVRSCNCCPYGYHIDLDFVRYCESLANAKPSEEELQRRSRRRSRKSMEFMLGLENIFDQWDAAERVQALPEAPHESEPDSPPHRFQPATSTPYHNGSNGQQQQRPRSSSVPRFTYGSITRSESPFGTASSTSSSIRGAESDAAATYSRSQQQQRAANGRTETRAMLREALDDVCSDFERTLERTSMKRKSKLTNGSNGGTMTMSFGTTYADRNNNNNNSGSQKMPNGFSSLSMDKRTCQTWERYFETFDSCVSGNKSPRNSRIYTRSNTLPFQQKLSPAEQQYESYVQATVAANAKSPVEVLERNDTSEPVNQAPPPPPRRHAHSAKLFSPTTSVTTTDSAMSPLSEKAMQSPQAQPQPATPQPQLDNANADAQTLYNIRQQMALSLKRMKDLEEQVKAIPEMQLQVTQLRNEKQRLEQMLQRKDDELQRTRELQRHSASSSPSPNASLKNATQFTPQRISPISLESMGSRIRANSTSSERQLKPAILKRDVGTMCGLYATRDIAVGTAAPQSRSTGTMPMQSVSLKEVLYTELEVKQQVQLAVRSYEMKAAAEAKQQERHCVSVGTQMYVVKPDVRDHGIQTSPEKQVLKFSVGVSAQPSTREAFTSCQADVRSIGCSNDSILDVMCTKCAVPRRTVACGTDEQLVEKPAVSLKLLEMPARSNTFSLGDNEKLNIKRKTIGTQCSAVALHTTGCQTTMQLVHSIGVQSVPECMAVSTQCQPTINTHRQTDTNDLQRLTATKVVAEEVATPKPQTAPAKPALPPKPLMRSASSNTDSPARTLDAAVNTLNNTPAVRHTASNTDQLHKRDVGCGDAVRPHISIACADNYCDSCKDAIKHLAKDFSKQPIASPLPIRAADSKIPRPRHLSSPSPVRKEFKRQNTYTVTPESTPTSSPEEKMTMSSFSEKPVSSFQQSDVGSTAEQCTTEPTKRSLAVSLDANANETHPVSAGAPVTQSAYDDVLLVKEETRVRISWSRDNSPAPLVTAATTAAIKADRESQENQLNNEKLTAALEAEQAKATAEELAQGARRKSTSPAAQQQPANTTSQEEPQQQAAPSQALLQKLAMVEEAPREKVKPPKDMLAALKLINDSLLKKLGAKPFSSASLKNGKATIQQEWFRVSSTEQANPHVVEDYLDCFENYSVPLLEYCVNMADTNGNTAMHYAVSHGNFDVVSILLDSKVCNVNQMNNAGYTSVMLVSLAKLKNVAHRTVVERLFQMADVNIRAKKHCQTALMLAVSHGNLDMVEMLLAAGADINIQDEDGSTALMCAAEHGRIDIVKHLLSQPDCDSLIQDIDGSTAFKIAWQAGHRDIGLILYVHEQMLRNKLPNRGEPVDSRTTRTPATLSPKQQHKRQPSK